MDIEVKTETDVVKDKQIEIERMRKRDDDNDALNCFCFDSILFVRLVCLIVRLFDCLVGAFSRKKKD